MPHLQKHSPLHPPREHTLAEVLFAKNGDGDRIRQIFSLAPVSALMNVFMALMSARTFIGSVPDWWVVTWFFAAINISVYFMYGKRRFRPSQISRLSKPWRNFMVVMALGITLIWLPIPIGAMIYLDGDNYLGALFMTVVMMTGTVVGLSSVPIAAVTSMVTATLPVLGVSVYFYGPINNVFVSFVMIMVILSVFSLKHSRMIWQMEDRGRQLTGNLRRLADAHENIRTLADMDQMTGLLNRRTFMQELETRVTAPTNGPGTGYMCALIDLDHFKNINDALGHEAGDSYLCMVANQLNDTFGDRFTIARLGGDEFAMVSHRPMVQRQAEAMGRKIAAILAHDVELGGRSFRGGGSVGAALFPLHARGPHDWLNHADHALREAKATRRGSFRHFTDSDRVRLDQRLVMEANLACAIARSEIGAAYQPQIDMRTGALIGVEALARWTGPDGKPISPPEFFSLAESSGRVLDLSDVIFHRILADLEYLADLGIRLPSISVNLHPAQLHHPERLMPLVDRLATVQGGAENVMLEITENSIIGRGAENVPTVLNDLAERGFSISLDDFGTGFASLTHLQTLPIAELKIDRNFVRNIDTCHGDQEIVRALLMIAQPRNLSVVLEGVETEAQRDLILSLGGRIGQGYLFSRPLDLPGLRDFVPGCPAADVHQLPRRNSA